MLIGTVAAFALAQGIAGLYRLADYDRSRIGALSGPSWAIAYGPPVWLVLLLIATLALLSLALLWRVPGNRHARLLALFSALLANGYAVVATVDSSPLFHAYLAAMPIAKGWDIDVAWLRTGAGVVAALERLLWVGAWPFAAAVSVLFVRSVLGLGRSARSGGGSEALLVLWSFALVAACVPASPVVPAVAMLLTALAVAGWWRDRRLAAALPAWMFAPGAALAMLAALPRIDAIENMLVATALLAVWVVPRVRRAAPVRPRLLLVLPALLAMAVALHGDGAAVAGALFLMLYWVGVCLLVVLWTILGAIGSLPPQGRRQGLWFLSGWTVSTVAVAVWLVSIWGGRLATCTPTSLSATCWLHRHQDWFFVAPLPILLLSFIVALLYRGPIDAARLFRRSVVYGSMLMLTLFVLGVSEALLGEFVRRGLPWETPPLVATGLMAVVLYPAKRVCDRGAERLLARILRWAERDASSFPD